MKIRVEINIPEYTFSSIKHTGCSAVTLACMPSDGTGTQAFTAEEYHDEGAINKTILFAQIQSYYSKKAHHSADWLPTILNILLSNKGVF